MPRHSIPHSLALLAVGLTTAAGSHAASGNSVAEPRVGYPVVFFPPTPPVYGATIEDRQSVGSRLFAGRRLLPPDGLADFSGEYFYPPLATRLFSLALSRSMEARLDQYRSKRSLLLNALLDELLVLHDAPAETRERKLRAFALGQTPEIVGLESEADQLREDLIRGGGATGVDWNERRQWRLGSFSPEKEWAAREGEFQVVRATAYYQAGLTAPQRGLLRELATELESAARKARNEPAARIESDAMFFSPETSRLRLPPGLNQAALARIGAYNQLKAALKRELRDAINEHDRASAKVRNAAFAVLAEIQWPRFGELEALADEVRGDIVDRFDPAAPVRPPSIPAWLVETINAYNEERDSYYGEMSHAMRSAAERVPRPGRGTGTDEEMLLENEFDQKRSDARRAAAREYQLAHAARFAALEQHFKMVREALGTIAKTELDTKTGRPADIESLLRRHAMTLAEFDSFGRATVIYGNYRLAMLQRGLSPEQRRLLFGAAVSGLAQALPFGEVMPLRAAKYPILP